MVKEAVEVSKQASYDLGVQETAVCLAEELAEVCRDYCKEVWMKALNLARVPTASKWRQDRNVYYPLNIHEIPAELPPLVALASVSSKQPLITQTSISPPEISKGPGQACDQGQEAEVATDKDKDNEVKPSLKTKAKEAETKVKDVASKAKEAETKSKEVDPKTANQPTSQLGNKEDPPFKAKA